MNMFCPRCNRTTESGMMKTHKIPIIGGKTKIVYKGYCSSCGMLKYDNSERRSQMTTYRSMSVSNSSNSK